MKVYNWLVLGILLFLGRAPVVKAQNVHITVPTQNIFTHSEFTTVQTVMNTQGHKGWNGFLFTPVDPKIRSISGNLFMHQTSPGITLPTSVLRWRLASIGGELPPFSRGGTWPGYKWFTTSNQTWYEPYSSFSKHPAGDINFTFKIPQDELANNAYHAGEYSIEVSQNYVGGGFFSSTKFSPGSFYTILSIPKAISWLTASNIGYREISSLNQFRTTPTQVVSDLGTFELGNTVDFNLFAKSASSTIQFTSSKGVQETLSIALLSLGGDSPKINTIPLSSSWQNFTSGNHFPVKNGNRHNFHLRVAVSQSDFKSHFFRAGTYKFQVDFNAKSTDNTIAAQQTIDYTLKVLPLSEINILNGGNTVNFDFNTAAQYQNGETKLIPNQIRLSNNETYELYVKADAPFFKREGIQSDVPSSILKVGVEGGAPQVTLSATPQKIVNNGSPVLDKALTMKYSIPPEAAQTLVAKENDTYSTTIIYSFTAL